MIWQKSLFLSMAFVMKSADFYKVFQDLKHILTRCLSVGCAVYSRWQSGLLHKPVGI